MKILLPLLCLVFATSFVNRPDFVAAQGFGGFGGAGMFSPAGNAPATTPGQWHPAANLVPLSTESALNVITIDGTADIRVVPDEIRVVLAITNESEKPEECQEKDAAQVRAVLNAWAELNIPKEKIVTDFINVLPRYEWRVSERDGQQIRIQQRVGYRMQSNLHVSVKTEQEAMAAINRAFQAGVADIVTFDYWNSRLNEHKQAARDAAIQAAKQKAAMLLAVFEEPPKAVNVQERTEVFFPNSLYRTFENVLEEETQYSSRWENLPMIKAYRPKMTFFHGLQSQSDIGPAGAAMRPEIAVVSTVRLYYQSPATRQLTTKDKSVKNPFE